MKHLERDGVKLFFEDAGSGTPPIVLVHGWTCDRTYFAPQRDHLSRRHRVVSVDLRGHGESDKPNGPYTIALFADDVAWLCGALRLEKPVIVGHSMGGMVALELAARHPQLPSAIVACDSPILPPAALVANLTAVTERLRQPGWHPTRRAFIGDALFIAADDARRKQRIIEHMMSAPDHVTLGCWEAIVTADSAEALRQCKVPFLYVAAASPLMDVARAQQLCPTLVVGQTVGAGHFHQLEVPEQVNAMIDRFLSVSRLA